MWTTAGGEQIRGRGTPRGPQGKPETSPVCTFQSLKVSETGGAGRVGEAAERRRPGVRNSHRLVLTLRCPVPAPSSRPRPPHETSPGSGCGARVPTVQAAASFPTGRSAHFSGKKSFRFPRSQRIYQTKRKDLKVLLLNAR